VARWEKLLAAMLTDTRPRSYTYDDMVTVLTQLGFTLARRGSGSHRNWRRELPDSSEPNGHRTVNIGLVDSGSGTLKAVYVKQAMRTLRENNLLPPEV
jgi:predicted RNA binding protein YcfA (HicA-like mRNA interferase family)